VQLGNPERDRTKGLGLGLSIVLGLSNQLGHQLEVESSPGKGSTFSILIPVVAQIPLELLGSSRATDVPDVPDLSGMTVAIVEDEIGPRESVRELLVEWGCYVIDGESSEEVIRKIQEEGTAAEPHLIISDYRLREGRTGIAAIKDIRAKRGTSVPAVVWSAETSPAVLQEVAAEGWEMLAKPPDEKKLLSVLMQYRPACNADVLS
jgi:two-component system, sensor histidine kinase